MVSLFRSLLHYYLGRLSPLLISQKHFHLRMLYITVMSDVICPNHFKSDVIFFTGTPISVLVAIVAAAERGLGPAPWPLSASALQGFGNVQAAWRVQGLVFEWPVGSTNALLCTDDIIDEFF